MKSSASNPISSRSRQPSKTHVGLIQMRCEADPVKNRKKAVDLIHAAAKKGAKLICLPELFASEYFCQSESVENFELAETIPGPSTDLFSSLAAKLHVVIVASLFEKRAPGLYHNTTVVIESDGSLAGMYRKMHIPDDPLFYEKYYFTPGDLGFRSFSTSQGEIGICICWDQWFPEAARLTALHGAKIIFYPTAIGWHPKEKAELGVAQHDSWETIQRSHAIANGCFVVSVNRIGHEAPAGGDGLEFWGQSFVCGPNGRILAKASEDAEEVLVSEIDFEAIEFQRGGWPFLRDRRIDAYADLNKRYLD